MSSDSHVKWPIALCSWTRGRWWRAARRIKFCRIPSTGARASLFPPYCPDFLSVAPEFLEPRSDLYLQRVSMNVSLRLTRLAALVTGTVALTLSLSVSLAHAGTAPSIGKSTLVAAIVPNYPPFEYKDPATDKLMGFDADPGKAIAAKL